MLVVTPKIYLLFVRNLDIGSTVKIKTIIILFNFLTLPQHSLKNILNFTFNIVFVFLILFGFEFIISIFTLVNYLANSASTLKKLFKLDSFFASIRGIKVIRKVFKSINNYRFLDDRVNEMIGG